MPELPEVETVCQGLLKATQGLKIAEVVCRRDALRFPLPKGFAAHLSGRRIESIGRRAKYILLRLSGGETLIVHLGMSGRLFIDSDKKKDHAKHDHVIFYFNDGTVVRFNDPRRFGLMDIAANDGIATHKLFKHLGAEPLDEEFSGTYLHAQLQRRKIAVKLAIMDQKLVVGVGNIYASEALYDARISPNRPAHKVTAKEAARLQQSIKKVLRLAIKSGGSSLRDYVRADGELGYFQHHFKTYGREGEKCPNCKGLISKIIQGGRSSFYCPKCQK